MEGKARYTSSDIGCWVDGAYGIDHALAKIADMLSDLPSAQSSSLARLLREDTESADEMLDEACDLLAEHTDPGLIWVWVGGDLLLLREEECGAC
jgi:hypothetical protein